MDKDKNTTPVENISQEKQVSSPRVSIKTTSAESWFAETESLKPGQSRFFLPSQKKRSHFGRNIFILVILGLLSFGGFKAYKIYWPKLINARQPSAENNLTTNVSDNINPYQDNQEEVLPRGDAATTTPELPAADAASTTPTTPAPKVVPPASAPVPAGPKLKVNSTSTGYLNVRSEPASSSKLVVQIHPGETYPYTETKYDWYKITLPDGQSGWVSGTYVTKQ